MDQTLFHSCNSQIWSVHDNSVIKLPCHPPGGHPYRGQRNFSSKASPTFDLQRCSGLLIPRVARVITNILSISIIDEELYTCPLLPHLVLVTWLQHHVSFPPLHGHVGFGHLAAQHGRAPFLHLLVFQPVFEKHGQGLKEGMVQREREKKKKEWIKNRKWRNTLFLRYWMPFMKFMHNSGCICLRSSARAGMPKSDRGINSQEKFHLKS